MSSSTLELLCSSPDMGVSVIEHLPRIVPSFLISIEIMVHFIFLRSTKMVGLSLEKLSSIFMIFMAIARPQGNL
jgi:hypothetical protein